MMQHDGGSRAQHSVGVLIAAIAIIGAAASAPAQIPDKFTNLQVLPKDISKPKLVETMRGYCNALGVRCTFCHVGEEGPSFDGFDFASDAKDHKATTRLMMQMTADLNSKWISRVKSDRRPTIQVTCAMCHHGKPEPRSIQEVLGETIAKRGAAAASSQYRELREKFYGRDTYDFGERPLNDMGQALADDGKTTDAIALLELNAEFHPKSVMVHNLLAAAYERAGDKTKATASYRKVLELSPDDERAKRKLAELGSARK